MKPLIRDRRNRIASLHVLGSLLATAALLAGSDLRAATHFDVYLLAGQSNMDGRGKTTDLTEAQRASSRNVMIFYRNPPACTEGWKPLAPGFSIPPGYKSTEFPSPTFGPELGFAAAMIRGRPVRRLALIKGSKGGTSLAKDWKPGTKGESSTQGPCYSNFIATVAMGMQALTNDGSTATICGMLWHQGESDANSTAEVYQKLLTGFIARLREDLGMPNLPVAVGEVFDNGKRDNVRAAQRAVAKSVPHVAFVPVEGTKTWDAGTHFDATSQILLGERFAEAMLKLTQP